MRYVLATIFVCVAGMPAAAAVPMVSPASLSVSKADLVAQVAKRSRPKPQRQSRKDSGIHPLVGSGDY